VGIPTKELPFTSELKTLPTVTNEKGNRITLESYTPTNALLYTIKY